MTGKDHHQTGHHLVESSPQIDVHQIEEIGHQEDHLTGHLGIFPLIDVLLQIEIFLLTDGHHLKETFEDSQIGISRQTEDHLAGSFPQTDDPLKGIFPMTEDYLKISLLTEGVFLQTEDLLLKEVFLLIEDFKTGIIPQTEDLQVIGPQEGLHLQIGLPIGGCPLTETSPQIDDRLKEGITLLTVDLYLTE